MYSINSRKRINGKIYDILIREYLPMGSPNKLFMINGCEVKSIKVTGIKLATPIATDMVSKKYKKLLEKLADLLVDDDDSGDSYREALNEIERFRLLIKNKYRDFLEKKSLEIMAKQLVLLQKEAEERLFEIRNNYYEAVNGKRGK